MKKIYSLLAGLFFLITAIAQTPVPMSSQPGLTYIENFADIANWTNGFTSGSGANRFGTVPVNTMGTIPDGVRITTATTSFTTGTSGGVQKGTEAIVLLSTGSTDNTSSSAIDFFMDFSGVNAGTLSFNWASVNNSTGDRKGSLRVYYSTDGSSFTELSSADVLNFTNNASTSGSITSVALPAAFNNSSTARLRFYYHNGTGGTTGSRPKISIDNLIVTATQSGVVSPSISVSPSSLSGFSTAAGVPSASQSITVSGINLTDDITITSSGSYEISIDNIDFSTSPIILSQTGGTVNSTIIYSRISSSALPGSANGSLTLTSADASNKSVSLSGTVTGVISLSSSPYIENFNGIGAGLPAGITTKTGATSSALGTDAAFTSAISTSTSWGNTSGGFKNFASGNNEQGVVQSTATDRAIGVRQVTATDQGTAFVFQIANTSGKINFTLDFNLQSLDASSPRITTWRVDYGFGINPSSFIVPTTTGILTTGGNTFSNNPIHVDFGNALDNQSGSITIRIVTVTPTSGSGNRPSTGIDDFTLNWEDPAAKTISLNAASLDFPVTNTGSGNTLIYKIVKQTNLDQPISVAATAPYSISTDNITFTSSLSIAPADAFDKTIYVKFSPVAAGVYQGTITHSSEGAVSKIINLSGEAIDPNALAFNFNTCSVSSIPGSGFLSVNIAGTQKWKCSQFGRNGTNGVDVNGFVNGAAQTNDAWLISPALNLNNIVNIPVLSFYSRGEFSGPKLQLYVSTNYDGSSVPDPADWTEITNAGFPTPPGSATTTWTFSDNIDLSAYKPAPKVYIAFRYTSSSALNAARWSLDDVAITDQSTLLTVNPAQLNFGEVAAGTNSASQAISFKAIGSTDLTVTVPAGYQISTDNSSFTSNAIIVTQATAAAGTTLYVRFSPTSKELKAEGNINVSAEGLNKDVVELTGSSYPKSETFDVACYNISFFGAGSTNSATPEQIATQVANISTVMQRLNADVIGIEEMSNDAALTQLVATLPGYASVISPRWSYSFNPPDPSFPPQKIGFVYNTATMSLSTDEPPRVMFESMYDSARLNLPGHRLTDYPTGTPSSFWASGRLPFMATFNTTIDGVTQKIRIVVIHAKSGGDADGYTRRQYDAKVLEDSLDAYYANDKVIIVGDYNDRVVTSIYTGHQSSYQPLVDDNVNYDILTESLDAAGKTSFPGDAGMIDHITISNDLTNEYISNSTGIEDARAYIPNYNATTASDHLPVFSRYQFCKLTGPAAQVFCSETDGNYTIPSIATNANCGSLVYTYSISGATIRSGTGADASGAFNVGVSTITWTAVDNWGNSQTATTTVTVNQSPTAIIPDAYALPSGTLANTVYIGYAPASSITLNALSSGGTPGYSYSWTNGSTTATTTVSPLVNTVYNVTITDQNGCQVTASKQIKVKDVRGGKKSDKVDVCHKQSNTLTVSQTEAAIHLSHGDMLGACGSTLSSNARTTGIETEEIINEKLALTVLPNPSVNNFKLKVTGNANSMLLLRITDISGRVIENKNLTANQLVTIGDNYRPGIYIAEIMQGNERKVIKLIKIK